MSRIAKLVSLAGLVTITLFGVTPAAVDTSTPVVPDDIIDEFSCGMDVLGSISGYPRNPDADCPFLSTGPCNLVENRDAHIPDENTEIKVIRLFFNIFTSDDGSDPAVTPTQVSALVDKMNLEFLPYRIQFVYDWRYVADSDYRQITASTTLLENDPVFLPMKDLYAYEPATQCNVYAVEINPGTNGFSFAYPPWGVYSLGKRGGTVISKFSFPPTQTGIIPVHELGHVFGLYHTHVGVSEVQTCGDCGEVPLSPNRDVVGDLCSDTWPTPRNTSCIQPGGFDPCDGEPWGTTDTQNIMGYSFGCATEFSPQQVGRMHCWIEDRLSPWVVSEANCFNDTTFTPTYSELPGGPTYNWVSAFGLGTKLDPDSFYNSAQPFPLDDGTTGPHPIGFDFQFYDQIFNEIYIGANGLLSFADAELNVAGFFAPTTIPSAPFQTFIAPFYADLVFDTTAFPSSGIYLYSSPGNDTLVIEWHQAANFNNPSESITFEVIFSADGNIAFQYEGVESSGLTSNALIGIQDGSCSFRQFYNGGDEPSPAEYQVVNNSTVHFRYFENMGPCCMSIRGNVNGDVNESINISDMTYIVSYLFGIPQGPAPSCLEEGNVNGDPNESINISDITYLVNYLFGIPQGPIPPDCPPLY